MKNIRKIVLICFICFMASVTTGCLSGSATRREAINHVEKKLGLENYKISRVPESTENGSSWEVYDEDEDFSFYVYSTLQGSGDIIPEINRVISDDYEAKYVQRLAKDFPDYIVYDESIKRDKIHLSHYYFEINYTNKEELYARCKEFWKISKKIREKGDSRIMFRYRLSTPHDASWDKMYYPPLDYSLGDFYGYIGQEMNADYFDDYLEYCNCKQIQSMDELIEQVKLKYFTFGYVYQEDSVLSEMTTSDIDFTVENNELLWVYVVKDLDKALNPDEKKKVYAADGEVTRFCGECLAYEPEHDIHRITYGGLYQLLLAEGFEISGTPEHFTYLSNTGDVYEFSYDFWNDGDGYSSYYLKNGEQVFTNLNEKNALNHKQILEIFGIYVDFCYHFPYLSNDAGRVF
ncbi:hypothetical protein SAMN02910298_00702 [Pseudobutyrivibrio sp. YE44]|uniref:hypothetical protein n=1 Tax=Pseudobutyrivibrio sp. YE44 TaxID=1520802 RepID=UPI00088F599F|nr:hypothetical protein [Pseudobutyrivibrio sp. YE44]SDB13478.1 hypothetical protein SAMN02910298_00702 [Pseudobutyrivibrio sp. YE44]